MRTLTLVALIVAAAVVAGSSLAGREARWTITDLGTLGGQYKDCVAAAVNDQNQIVGGCGDPRGRQHAFLWQRGKLTFLGTLGGHDSGASLINGRGQVAGTSLTAKPAHVHGFLWQRGKMTDLGTLGGKSSRVRAMNDRGQVVGESETADGKVHAYIWQAGTMADLGTLGGRNSIALGINDRGQVVGGADTRGGKEHAFLWRHGKMTDLGTLGGGYTSSQAMAINAAGAVVGASYSDKVTQTGQQGHAFLWLSGRVRDLGTVPGDRSSSAVAINDPGVAAGWSTDDRGGFHPLVWRNGKPVSLPALGSGYTDVSHINARGTVIGTSVPRKGSTVHAVVWQSGKVTDLGTLGGDQSSADAINGQGWIVGTAWLKNGHRHGVLWRRL